MEKCVHVLFVWRNRQSVQVDRLNVRKVCDSCDSICHFHLRLLFAVTYLRLRFISRGEDTKKGTATNAGQAIISFAKLIL